MILCKHCGGSVINFLYNDISSKSSVYSCSGCGGEFKIDKTARTVNNYDKKKDKLVHKIDLSVPKLEK